MAIDTAAELPSKIDAGTPFFKLMRSCFACLLWMYFAIKVLLIDVDAFICHRWFPNTEPWLIWRPTLILVPFFAFLLGLKFPWVLKQVCYISFYPLIFLVTVFAPAVTMRWHYMLLLSPALYDVVRSSKMALFTYISFIVSFTIISSHQQHILISLSMLLIVLALCAHVSMGLMRQNKDTVFSAIRDYIKSRRPSIQGESFSKSLIVVSRSKDKAEAGEPRPNYLLGVGITTFVSILTKQIDRIATGRHIYFYLFAQFAWSIVVIIVSFAFLYLGASQLGACCHSSASLSDCFEQSFGIFLGTGTSKVFTNSPSTLLYSVLLHSEGICKVVLLCLLFFTTITATRETYREHLTALSEELQLTSAAVEAKIVEVLNTPIADAEIILLNEHPLITNWLRRLRGEVPLDPKLHKSFNNLSNAAVESRNTTTEVGAPAMEMIRETNETLDGRELDRNPPVTELASESVETEVPKKKNASSKKKK